MEHLTQILIVIFGAGGIGSMVISSILFYRSNRRAKEASATIVEAEAQSAEIKNEQTEVDRLETRLKVRDDKVDALYGELRQEQVEKQQILVEKHRLEIELEILKLKRCDVRGCASRQPPGDY